jgi:hypothetical protein
MPRFSKFFQLGLSQHELDFVDIDTDHDTPVYVDPFAIEIKNDIWAAQASEHIRVFFREVLDAIRDGDEERAKGLMSHLTEPRETYLGVSRGDPQGRGVGRIQAGQLIQAIANSNAYKSGVLTDLSEMALYVDGVDRDKISDLTTNIIRSLLVDYTQQQCALHQVPVAVYRDSPPIWDATRRNWVAMQAQLPFIGERPVLLVPKYIVRRKLSLDSQEFYNKQITDFLVSENIRANSSLVQMIKGMPKVYKKDVRERNPKSKAMIAETVVAHPELLDLYKQIAKDHGALVKFDDDDDKPTLTAVCAKLADLYQHVPPGKANADRYHNLVLGSLTALLYPDLITPQKEWEVHEGRKRIDIVYTNAADTGFFAQRRGDPLVNANVVIVECKNYSDDIANPELDQLLGRFDGNRGKLGIITCRAADDPDLLLARCRDASSRQVGYMIVLTDADIVEMLVAKSQLQDARVQEILHRKYRELLS